MFRQQFTATDAHAKIVQYFESEFMNIMQVKVLFRRFKDENYEGLPPANLQLVENYKIKKHGLLGYCKFYDYGFNPHRMPGMKMFCKAVDDQHKKCNQWKFYNRDFLRGYINFLKSQGKIREEIYALVMGLTKQELLTIDNITEDLELEKNELVANCVQRSFEPKQPEEITSVHCDLHGQAFRFVIEPEMIEMNYDYSVLQPGNDMNRTSEIRLIYENGDVWLSKTKKKPNDYFRRLGEAWRTLQQSSSIIENLTMSIDKVDPDEILTVLHVHGPIDVKNAFIYYARGFDFDNSFDSIYVTGLAPGVLKKIVIYCEGLVGPGKNELFLTEQFLRAEEFITNGRCLSPHESFAHLKFGRFQLGSICEYKIKKLKDQLLTKPTDFREMKFEVETFIYLRNFKNPQTSRQDFPPVDMETLQFEKFPYPEPNQDKFLELAVVNNHFFWFRGPGRIPGEMEQVEKEMELHKPNEGGNRETENLEKLPMHRGCFEERVYTLPEGFESD